ASVSWRRYRDRRGDAREPDGSEWGNRRGGPLRPRAIRGWEPQRSFEFLQQISARRERPNGVACTAADRFRFDTRQAFEHEGVDEHIARMFGVEAACHEIEQAVFVKLPDRGTVRAAHVFGVDFEFRLGVV